MNKARRKEIEKARGLIEDAKGILDAVAGEEQEYYETMPESLQGGDKGQQAEAAATALQEAADSLDEVIQNCDTALQ